MVSRKLKFTAQQVAWRAAFALIITLITFNPIKSFFGSLADTVWSPMPWGTILFALILVAGWAFILINAKQLLGKWGFIAILVIFGTFVAMLVSKGMVSSGKGAAWIGTLGLWLLATISLTGGYIFRYLTGRLHVEDGDMDA
ncbi:MAG: DUF6524 family protein [Myxococcota bacterium]|nr:DUF6524 family protein [Myxococcota bacterium]